MTDTANEQTGGGTMTPAELAAVREAVREELRNRGW